MPTSFFAPLRPPADPPTAGEGVRVAPIPDRLIPASRAARKLHAGHFAFMRAVVQGIDSRAAWDRYLRLEGEHRDARIVKRVIDRIRHEFAAAAKRHHRPGLARLVQFDASTIPDTGNAPTLEEFIVERGLDGFSESEQLEEYVAVYGEAVHGKGGRRERLIRKQLDALLWLEQLVAEPPLAADPLSCWLNPDWVSYLAKAQLFTVRALIEHINGIGRRWWASIPAIGAHKAHGILHWLKTHEASIGLTVGAHVAVARSKLYEHELARIVPRATAIVPIDKFIVPQALNGEQGAYRAPRHLCLLRANNDYEAVLTWIKSKHGLSAEQRAARKRARGLDPAAPELAFDWLNDLSHTQRAYLKEAERFMLWAIVERQKPLSSMTLEDCNAYRDFLSNPSPIDRWCAPRSRQKWSPLWRPFEGPLSERAQAHALTILKSLYKFLVDQCYLVGNPWNGVTVPKSATPKMNRGRSFTREQWSFILGQAEQLDASSASQRLRFALSFLYATGLRLAEAVAARVDDLNWVTYPGTADDPEAIEGWELSVIGKGNKQRIVPVPLDAVSDLATYLASRGLDPDPEHTGNRGTYLFGQATDLAERAPFAPRARQAVNPKAGIAAGTLYNQLKAFFTDCSHVLAQIDEKSALRLAQASTHWLRHTHGSHAVAAGMPLDVLQQNMGHASIDTTTIYTTAEDRRRMKAMQQAWEKSK